MIIQIIVKLWSRHSTHLIQRFPLICILECAEYMSDLKTNISSSYYAWSLQCISGHWSPQKNFLTTLDTCGWIIFIKVFVHKNTYQFSWTDTAYVMLCGILHFSIHILFKVLLNNL